MTTETPALITANQAAKQAGVSRRTIVKYVESGRLTVALKLPTKTGAMLFRQRDIDVLTAERRAELEAALAAITPAGEA